MRTIENLKDEKERHMGKATKFIRTMQENTGWKLAGSTLIGQQDHYWFTIAQAGFSQPIVVTAALANAESAKLEQLKQAVKDKKKVYKLNGVTNENQLLKMVINPDTNVSKNAARVTELIFDLTKSFARLDLKSGCPICGADEPLTTVRIGDNPAAICEACHQNLKVEFEGIVQKNAQEGSYVTGTIGALLGALVGSALWLLVSYLGYFASIVGFVMAFLAQFGYRLFKGRIRKGMPVIILVSVIIGIFVANAIEIAIGLAQDPEVGLTFFESLRYAPMAFYDNELFYVGQVWANVGMGLLFAMLGSWRTIRSLASETKGKIYQVETI